MKKEKLTHCHRFSRDHWDYGTAMNSRQAMTGHASNAIKTHGARKEQTTSRLVTSKRKTENESGRRETSC
jgi:Fic family protein